MDARHLAVELIESIVARGTPGELAAARRGVRRVRIRRLRGFARERVRAARASGAHPAAALRRARLELAARALRGDELCLALVDVVDRHLARAHEADGSFEHDRRRLRDALARHALRTMEIETGLRHATSDLPAVAVRALLRGCGFEPSGAELVELLERLSDATGRRAAARCAADLSAAAPGLCPALFDALVLGEVRALGFDPRPAAVRAVARRERAAVRATDPR